jgi:dolichol-phosphate mannosyltransferase
VRVAIIIPTYNEAGNIRPLVGRLTGVLNAMRAQGIEAHVLFVDDDSPDQTWRLIEEMATARPEVGLLRRPYRAGIGSAYIDGFRFALARWHVDALVQMDADLQHPPEFIPVLIQALLKGADVAIASRHLPKASRAERDLKALLSELGNKVLSMRFGLGLSDATSGFRALRRWAAEALLSYGRLPSGFLFQLEQTRLLKRLGARIDEVPFRFDKRNSGRSKFSYRTLLRYIETLLAGAPTLSGLARGRPPR